MIITDSLAQRLESAESIDAAGCVEAACRLDAGCGAATRAVAGGVLTFCGPESPLTHATGIGMHGPVTAGEIADIEHFFRSRGAAVAIDVCPHADSTLRDLLSDRGYRITDYNNVLVRNLPVRELPVCPMDLHVRAAESDDLDLYARTVVRGFFGRDEMTEEEFRLGQMLFRMPCTTNFLAALDSETIGGAGLSIRNGVASFFGDAVLRAYRGRGVHCSIIAERLRRASEAGCDIATAGTQPGSISQRNYQRLGFEVAYSKVTMVKAG